MSGGHFDYQQHRIEDIATEIDNLIANNSTPDEFGDTRNYSFSTIKKFYVAVKILRKAADMAHRIDYLVSGDEDEEDFLQGWEDDKLGGKK